MNREAAAGATSAKAPLLPDWWPEAAIILVAFALRIFWLELKPPHFDEGVNGFFVDQMTRSGPYHYDPTNFHGPLHFYILFLMQTLFGRHLWALRLPTVIFSTLCVVAALGYRRYLSRTTCLLAACAMALSPAMSFYGRYAIHESFMLLSLMVAVWGIIGLWREGGRPALWATGLGITGMILTKETYAIHLATLLLAAPTLYTLEQVSRSTDEPYVQPTWTEDDLKLVLAICFGLIVFFYSGAFLAWGDLPGLWLTFVAWTKTGTDAKGGHVKEWHYWFTLLLRYEWAALFGLGASFFLACPGTSRTLRYMAISAGAALAAYSIIRYKTPWCIIVIIWPFFFVFGWAVEQALAGRLRAAAAGLGGALAAYLIFQEDRPWFFSGLWPVILGLGWAAEWASTKWTNRTAWAGWVVAFVASTLLLGRSAYWSQQINFVRYTDENEPYVYVQTLPDIEKIMRPLRAMVAADRSNYHLRGVIFFEELGDGHPLPWLLGDFTHIDSLYKDSPARKVMDADFLVVQDPYVADVEDRLEHEYFREKFSLRGSSGLTGELYFDAAKFASVFPGREAEFQPRPAPADAPAPPAEAPVPPPEPP